LPAHPRDITSTDRMQARASCDRNALRHAQTGGVLQIGRPAHQHPHGFVQIWIRVRMSTANRLSEPDHADREGDVHRGVDSYGRVLRGAGGNQVQALVRGSQGQGVGAALYETPPFEVDVPALSVPRLSVNLTKTTVVGGLTGGSMRRIDSPRYALYFTPAGASMTFSKPVPARHLNIYFHPDAFRDAGGAGSPLALSAPLLNAVVPGIRNLVDQLVDELRSPVMLHADAADSLARLLLIQVARHWESVSKRSRPLPPALLEHLRDYVMGHLGERILVADLARQAGLSIDTFAAAFKEQTGQAPHQFVLATRLEHATGLLRQSNLSVADVAHACGFSSQQHMTNVMHSHLGTTPRRYRDSMRASRADDVQEGDGQ
jgi:AraC family transcriptional regulator